MGMRLWLPWLGVYVISHGHRAVPSLSTHPTHTGTRPHAPAPHPHPATSQPPHPPRRTSTQPPAPSHPRTGRSTSPAASTPRTLRRPRLHAPPPQTHTRAQRVLGPVRGGSTALRPDNDGTAGRRGALTHHPPTNTPIHTGAARSHASQPHAAVVVRPQPHRAPPSRRPWTSARRIHRAPPRQRRDCGAR